MPANLKVDLINKLHDYTKTIENLHVGGIVRNAINAWEKHMNTPFEGDIKDSERHLLRSTLILDKRRNEKFLDVNPQYVDWFTEIENSIVDKSFLNEIKHDDTLI